MHYVISKAKANTSLFRVFIARSLVKFLPDVDPGEAVDYVIPLMNGLAMDEGMQSILGINKKLD